MTEFQAVVFDEALEESQKARTAAAYEERRDKVREAVSDLAKLYLSDPYAAENIPFVEIFIPREGCCHVCDNRPSKFIPAHYCQHPGLLPPFADCSNTERGCNCSIIVLDKNMCIRMGLVDDDRLGDEIEPNWNE